MVEIIAILVLAFVCIGQAIDKYLFTNRMMKQLDDAIKASMSRNLGEYMAATQEKVTRPAPQVEDTVELSNASDEEFDKYRKQNS